jgi:hypothetical protein
MTLLEIQERLIANCGERFSSSVLWRFFDRHELTFKNVWPAPFARGLSRVAADQSASTYPASEIPPGQDGDTRAPVLIKLPASSAVF